MSNLSDNELDKLSREAAEKYEPAENAQSWNKLEQLLDKNLGKPSPVPRLAKPGMPILYTGIILLAVATSYLLIKTIRNSQNFTPKINASNTPQSQGNNISRKDSSTLILKDKRDEPRLAERASDKTELADQKSAAGIKNNDQKDLPGLPKITSDQSPS